MFIVQDQKKVIKLLTNIYTRQSIRCLKKVLYSILQGYKILCEY